MSVVAPLAHVSPHGVLAFLAPVVAVIVWMRLREWRERRAQRAFAELVVLARRGESWIVQDSFPDETAPPRQRPPDRAPWREPAGAARPVRPARR